MTMEKFRQPFPDEPPSPSPPPPPPQFWLQPPPPPPPQSSCGFTPQPTTRAGCRIPPGFGLDNDYLNQRIGHNAEYIGRANENIRRPIPEFQRCPEKDTSMSCRFPPGFGLDNDYLNQRIGHNAEYIGRANDQNVKRLNSVIPEIQRCPEKDTRKSCMINPGFGIGGNAEYYGQVTGRANGNVPDMLHIPDIGRDANGNVDMLYNINPEMQREAEKKKIREEIIAAEMAARRRELEAEVREELRIEREQALKMKGVNAFDNVRVPMVPWGKALAQEVEGLSLGENIAMSAEERLRIQGRTETIGMDMFPFQRMSSEFKVNETGQDQEMEKVICPAKPSSESAESSSTQKESSTPAKKSSAYSTFGVWGVRNNIQGKKEWRCFICQVSASSETDLKQHFNGNKHRSKRDALKAEKRAALQAEEKAVPLSRSEPLLPTPSPIVSAKPSFDGKSTSMLPENKNKGKVRENFAFWCEMCNAGANNKYVMEAHKKGKKHLERLQKKFPFWCDLCKVGAEREHIMEAHLKGKKHLNMLQEKAASSTSSA